MKTELPTKEKLGSKDPEKIKVIRSPTDKNTVNESIDAVINEEFFVDEYEHSVDFDRGAGIIRIDIDRNLEAPEVPVSDLQLEAIETDVRENFQDALKNHPGVVVTVTQDRFGNIVAVLGDGDITVADDESNLVTVTTVETTDETERGFDRTQALVLEVNKEHTRTKSVKTTEDKVATFEIQQEKLIKTYEHTLRYNRKLMMVQEASLNLLIEEAAEFEEDLDTEIADAVNDIFDDEVSKFDLEAKDMQRELHKRVKQELKWEARLERESNERKLAIAQNQIFNINTALTPETFKKNRSPRRRRVSRLRKLPKIRRQKRRRMTKQEVKAFVKKRNLQLIAEQKKKKKLIKAVDVDEVEKLPKQKKRKKKQKQKVTLAENTGSQLTLMNEMKDDVKRSETEYNRNPNSQTWGHYMTSIGDLNDFIDKSSADEDKPGAVVIARHMEKSNTSNNYK
ncbi:MAG TPA: hypothetical protein ENI23_11835 [bacterium]|nr:hypothetical protein [bacterium]